MTGNEIVKEPIFQMTLKRIVRSSEEQKPRAYREDFTSGLEVSYGLRLALKSVFERNELFI